MQKVITFGVDLLAEHRTAEQLLCPGASLPRWCARIHVKMLGPYVSAQSVSKCAAKQAREKKE